GVVTQAQSSGLVKVRAGFVITRQLKLAESKHCPGRPGLLLYLGCLLECLRGLGVLVVIVIKRPEKPPTLRPRRAKTHCLAVQSDGLIDFVGFTRGACCRGDRVKILRARRLHWRLRNLSNRRGSWLLYATLAPDIHRT